MTACIASVGAQSAHATGLLTTGPVIDLHSEGLIPDANFGSAIAVENDTAVIAALQPGQFGLIVVYARTGSNWTVAARLDQVAGVDPSGFGYALSLSGDTLAVLSRPSAAKPSTAVSIFVRTAGLWHLQRTFTQDDWPIANVACIALSGDTLCLGNPVDAPGKSSIASGLVDVFVRTGSTWNYQKTLCPSDPIKGERFGTSIAMDNGHLAVGAPHAAMGKNPNRGACYIFSNTSGSWKQTAKLGDTTGLSGYQFGGTVALSGNSLLVNSPGRGQISGSQLQPYVVVKGTISAFYLSPTGTWQSEGLLPAPLADPDPTVIAAPQALGAKIALAGSLAVVCNPTPKATTDRSYLYQRRGSQWVQLAPVVDNGFDASTYDPSTYDPLDPPLFNLTSVPGETAAISGNTIIVGAPNENSSSGVHSGQSRFYNYVGGLTVFDGPTLSGPELSPDTAKAPINLTIGDLVINRAIKRSFTFQNLGVTTLTNMTFATDNPEAALAPVTVTSLPPLASVTVALTITPTTDGPWEANLIAKTGTGSNATTLDLDFQSTVNDGPSSPSIDTDPVSALLRDQASYELTADVTGTEPLSYQWFHNGKPCRGCTGKVMPLNPVSLADAGTYELAVTNEAGGAFSGPAEISVYQIQAATSHKANENDRIELDAPVAGAGITTGWFLNGVRLSDNTLFSGTSTSKLIIKRANAATAGRFTAVVNPGDTDITCKTWNVSVLLLPVIQSNVTSLSSISVTNSVTFHFVASPVTANYLFKGVPPGLIANAKTGTLTGSPTVPGNYTLRVAGINAAGTGPERIVPLAVLPLDNRAVGTFQGIIGRDPGNSGLGGTINLSITANGRCTGSATAGTRTIRFTSTTGLKPDTTPYRIEFQSTSAGVTDHYVLDIDPATGRLSGQLLSSTSPTTSASITGWINPWSSSRPATTWSDYLTLSISPGSGLSSSQTLIPYGCSFGTATVSPAGTVTWLGRMADGTVTTANSLISGPQVIAGHPDHVEIPLNFLLNAGKGSVQGLLMVQASATQPPHSAGGTLDWFKQPAAGRSYAAGITLHSLTVSGGHYAPPLAGTVIINLPVAISNAQLMYSGAGIDQASQYLFLPQPFTITTKGLVFFDSPNFVSNVLSLNVATGTFSGSLQLSDPNPAKLSTSVHRLVSSYGVLLQNQGLGFFNLAGLPDPNAMPPTTPTTTPVQSGRVTLESAN